MIDQQLRDHQFVQDEADAARYLSGEITTLRKFWNDQNYGELLRAPLSQRMDISKRSLKDAEECKAAGQLATELGIRNTGLTRTRRQVLGWEIDLRMGAAIIAPERVDEEHFENMTEAAILLARRIGSIESRNLGHVKDLMKLHDLEALDAFAHGRTGQENAPQAAKAMLGEIVLDAVKEINELSSELLEYDTSDGNYKNHAGFLAEFMYVTWERLHIFNHDDPNAASKIYVRSSLDREDRDKGFDAAIIHVDDDPTKTTAEAIQYKTYDSDEDYGPYIQMMRIKDWANVLKNLDEVTELFNMAITGPTKSERAEAFDMLGAYFSPSVVEQSASAKHPAAAL